MALESKFWFHYFLRNFGKFITLNHHIDSCEIEIISTLRSVIKMKYDVFFSRQQRRLLGRQDTWRDLGLLWQGTHERQAPGPGDRVELWGSSWLPK